MSCKPTYKGVRYNSLEELYKANGVNEQQKQEAQQKFQEYINANGRQDIEGFKEFVQKSELFNIGNIEQYSLYRNQFSNQLGFNGNPIVFGSEEDIQAFSDYLDNTIQDFTYKDDSPILQSAKNKYKRIGFESKDNYEDPKESETKVHSTKQKYAPISDYLESNIRNINNRILNLKNKIKVEKNPIIKKQLNAKLNKFEERLEAYELEKQELPKISGVEQLMAYGDAAIARVSTLLEQNNLSDADIEEARKLVQVWSLIGDFSPSMASSHILFTEEELESDILKYGATNKDGSFTRGFSYFKQKMDLLGQKVEEIASAKVIDFVREELRDPNIKEAEIFKILNDKNWIFSQTLSLNRVNDPLIQAISKHMQRTDNKILFESQERFNKIDELFKKANPVLKKNPNILKQKYKDGTETGDLIYRFTPEYHADRNELFIKATTNKSKESWDSYRNWIKDNNMYFDVRVLFTESGLPKSSAEADAHIAELTQLLGKKGFDHFYNQQLQKVITYSEARDGYQLYLNDLPEMSETETILKMRLWEYQNSPFINLDRILDTKETVIGNKQIYFGKSNYNQYIPRRISLSGKDTNYYDKNYEAVENDEILSELYGEITSLLKELREYIPESDRVNLQVNTLPFFTKALLSKFSEDGVKIGAKGVLDMVTNFFTENDIDEFIKTNPELSDYFTHEKRRFARLNLPDTTNKTIIDEIVKRRIKYINETGEIPSSLLIKQWRREIKDRLSHEKSWDLQNVLKLYTSAVLAYKHKSATESILNLAKIAVNQKADPKGIKNITDMMDYTMDVYFGDPKHTVDVPIKKVVPLSESKVTKELEDLIALNELNYKKKTITKITYELTKTQLIRQQNALKQVVSVSSIGDATLKYSQLLGLGFNVIAGVVNLMVGTLENVTRGADARLFSNGQLLRAYVDVLSTITGKATPLGKKLLALDKKLNITQKAQNELYDNTSKQFSLLKWFRPFIISEKTEYINQMPLALALMRNKAAFDEMGSEINLIDAFDENGNIKEGYTIDSNISNEDALSDLQLQIAALRDQTVGNYNPNTPILGKKTIWGRAAFQFRTWMPEMFYRRFGSEITIDRQLGVSTKGRYRSFSELFKNTDEHTRLQQLSYTIFQITRKVLFIPGRKTAYNTKGEIVPYKEAVTSSRRVKDGYRIERAFDGRLSALDAANMRGNLVELALVIQLILMKMILKSMLPDADDKNKKILLTLLNLGNRLKTDILLYANPVEYEKLSENIIPLTGYIMDVAKFGTSSASYLFNADEEHAEAFQKYAIKVSPLFAQWSRIEKYTTSQMVK